MTETTVREVFKAPASKPKGLTDMQVLAQEIERIRRYLTKQYAPHLENINEALEKAENGHWFKFRAEHYKELHDALFLTSRSGFDTPRRLKEAYSGIVGGKVILPLDNKFEDNLFGTSRIPHLTITPKIKERPKRGPGSSNRLNTPITGYFITGYFNDRVRIKCSFMTRLRKQMDGEFQHDDESRPKGGHTFYTKDFDTMDRLFEALSFHSLGDHAQLLLLKPQDTSEPTRELTAFKS